MDNDESHSRDLLQLRPVICTRDTGGEWIQGQQMAGDRVGELMEVSKVFVEGSTNVVSTYGQVSFGSGRVS